MAIWNIQTEKGEISNESKKTHPRPPMATQGLPSIKYNPLGVPHPISFIFSNV